MGRPSVPRIRLPVPDIIWHRCRKDAQGSRPRPRPTRLPFSCPIEAPVLERRPHLADVKAERALGPVTNSESAELGGMVPYPVL
jgi:hypothetical protein